MGGTQFDSSKNWIACCTDGYAIGSIDGAWALFGQFLTSPTGINSWAAVDAGLGLTPLTLAPGRRVRFDLVDPGQVPAPATLALLGLGLAAISSANRRRKTR